MRWLTQAVVKGSGLVVSLCLLCTLPCVYWAARLYSDLRLDLEELLPRQARSIQDLDEVRARLKSVESLGIIVLSEDIEASRRWVDDLARRLRELPGDLVSGVEYRIDREIAFFDRRKALFIELKDLRKLRDHIEDRIAYEKALYNPLNIFSEAEIQEPRLDISKLLLKYRGGEQAERLSRFPRGYYATPDEKKRAVLVYLQAGQTTVNGRARLKEEVEKAVSELDPSSYAPDLRVEFTGEVQNNIDEYAAVLGDVERSAWIVTTVVTLALLLYFKTVLGTLALLAALLVARFWAFAVAWFTVGHLNANSAFMGSIVLGSGITYGVVVLSRYLEERRGGRTPEAAARIAIRQSIKATWTAALAAGLAYGSLMATEFEGFRQYGSIGFSAMLLCWISAMVFLPSLLMVIERRVHSMVSRRPRPNPHRLFGPVVGVLGRHPWGALIVSGALTAVGAYELSRVDTQRIVETDLSRLRNKQSNVSGSGYWSKYQDEIFRSYLSPMVVLPRTELGAERVAAALKALQRSEGKDSPIVSVQTIRDFVPDRQRAKIEVLNDIRHLLKPEVMRSLSRAEKKLTRELLTAEAMQPFGVSDLPALVRDKFAERDGAIGKLVLVEPPLSSAQWGFDELDHFVTGLREAAVRAEPPRPGERPVPVAGSHPIMRDLFAAINRDGPRATWIALASVVVLVVLLFRRAAPVFWVLLSLFAGILWMAGFALLYGIKINFLNFIALPIGFGLGVDYGVNILERYRHEPERNLVKVLRETGSALTLCSFTTVVGYFSLIIASNQAFVSFGQLAVMGEIGTMLAAILMLPAILSLVHARRAPPSAPPALQGHHGSPGSKRAA